jgi:hypothetical protein
MDAAAPLPSAAAAAVVVVGSVVEVEGRRPFRRVAATATGGPGVCGIIIMIVVVVNGQVARPFLAALCVVMMTAAWRADGVVEGVLGADTRHLA